MKLSIIDNQGDYLSIWIVKDTLCYKLSGFELHQLVIAGANNMGIEFPPNITEEKKKEIYQLIAHTAQRLNMGDRPPYQFIYKGVLQTYSQASGIHKRKER